MLDFNGLIEIPMSDLLSSALYKKRKSESTRKLIFQYPLNRYDVDRSNFIDFMELKLMMEKLGEPQTHLALKDMIKTVDEDNDGQISFREVQKEFVTVT